MYILDNEYLLYKIESNDVLVFKWIRIVRVHYYLSSPDRILVFKDAIIGIKWESFYVLCRRLVVK